MNDMGLDLLVFSLGSLGLFCAFLVGRNLLKSDKELEYGLVFYTVGVGLGSLYFLMIGLIEIIRFLSK